MEVRTADDTKLRDILVRYRLAIGNERKHYDLAIAMAMAHHSMKTRVRDPNDVIAAARTERPSTAWCGVCVTLVVMNTCSNYHSTVIEDRTSYRTGTAMFYITVDV